jgi:hypothetical protein
MPQYRVEVTVNQFRTYYVDANNKEEAENLVNDAIHGDESAQSKVTGGEEDGMPEWDLTFEDIARVK